MTITTVLQDRFDQGMAALLILFIAGVYADAYNHINGAPVTFFSPEHAVFYTASMGILGLLGLRVYQDYDGGSVQDAIPAGYWLSAIGLFLFLAGGFADMLWHGAFGFETTTEALYSPSHLVLAIGAVLFAGGPLRSTMNRDLSRRWDAQFPAIISATATLSLFTFMTMYAHYLLRPYPAAADMTGGTILQQYAPHATVELGMVSILLQSALLVGVLLYCRQRLDLVPGAYLFIIIANAALMTVLNGMYQFLPAAVGAGITAELVHRYADRFSNPAHVFGFAVPAVYQALYFIILFATVGVSWTVHLWTGAVVLGGIAGLLTAYALSS